MSGPAIDSFDLGDSMTRVELTRGPDGDCTIEIIIYSSSPHYEDSVSYLTVSPERMKELALWLQP